MTTKQVKFRDNDGEIHGGILLDNNYIVCGCCGTVFNLKEELEENNSCFEILKEYKWISFEEYILDDEDDRTED